MSLWCHHCTVRNMDLVHHLQLICSVYTVIILCTIIVMCFSLLPNPNTHKAKMLKMEEELSRLRQEVVLQEQQSSPPPSRLAATPSRSAAGKGRTAHHSSTGGTCIHYINMISQYNDITMTSHVGWHYRTGEHFLLCPHTSSCFHHRQVIWKCPPAKRRKRKVFPNSPFLFLLSAGGHFQITCR